MKIAVSIWGSRVSPVFDVARRLLLVDVEGANEVGREEIGIEETQPSLRAKRLAELGVSTLICGAISTPVETLVTSEGMRVVGHVCGPVEEVLSAFLAGRLGDAFLMPGCCGRRQRNRGRCRGGDSGFDLQGEIG